MVSFNNKTIITLSNVYGSKIHLVTAIANPYLLILNLKKLGIDVIAHIYPDHQFFYNG